MLKTGRQIWQPQRKAQHLPQHQNWYSRDTVISGGRGYLWRNSHRASVLPGSLRLSVSQIAGCPVVPSTLPARRSHPAAKKPLSASKALPQGASEPSGLGWASQPQRILHVSTETEVVPKVPCCTVPGAGCLHPHRGGMVRHPGVKLQQEMKMLPE